MLGYGKELILDLHDCETDNMTVEGITRFMRELVALIDMEAEDLHFWEEHNPELPEHLLGISAVQFIRTSNITIHTLDVMQRVYLNIFSCKDFDDNVAYQFCSTYFKSKNIQGLAVVDRI